MDHYDDWIFRAPPAGMDTEQPTIYKSRRRLRRVGGRAPKPGKDPATKIKRPRRKRRWLRVAWISALILLVVVIALGAWFFVALKAKEPRMRLAAVNAALKPNNGGPDTTLIMGTDQGSNPGETGWCRSDVMLLLTIGPGGKTAGLISIPRDSRVQIPGHTGYDKINAAHAYGGPQLAIKTVENLTGLDVNHYVEMNFNGFKNIVNTVGGVRMNIPRAINDIYAGQVPAGDVVLNGDQALALVRARHDVNAVPNGDADRQKNQRLFIEAMLSTVAHQSNPFTVLKVADAVSNSTKTDLTFWKMFTLGRKLQSLKKAGSLATLSVPGTDKVIRGVWYYIINSSQFDAMLSKFKSGVQVTSQADTTEQSTTDPPVVRIKVLNGSGKPGQATSVSQTLTRQGYQRLTTGNAMSHYTKTTVYFGPGYDQAGQKIAASVGKGASLLQNGEVTTRYDSDVVVVIGSDYS